MQPETVVLPLAELQTFVAETRDLVQRITFDECGQMVAGHWVGGNGGLIQRETHKATDVVRRRLEIIAALIADHEKENA